MQNPKLAAQVKVALFISIGRRTIFANPTAKANNVQFQHQILGFLSRRYVSEVFEKQTVTENPNTQRRNKT